MVEIEPLNVCAKLTLASDSGLEALCGGAVDEKQIAPSTEVHVRCVSGNLHRPVESSVEVGGILRKQYVDRRTELLADASHGKK